VEQRSAPTAEMAKPPMRSLNRPKRSAKIPEGSSVKSLEINQDDDTSPTRISAGSSCRAKIGRNAEGRLMPRTSMNPTSVSSKYAFGYDLSPTEPPTIRRSKPSLDTLNGFLACLKTSKYGLCHEKSVQDSFLLLLMAFGGNLSFSRLGDDFLNF